MKSSKLIQISSIICIAMMIGACSEAKNDEPESSPTNNAFTINGIGFNSETNYGAIIQLTDFHGKGTAYTTEAVDDNSYPAFSFEFVCEAFEMDKSSIRKNINLRNIYGGYFYDKSGNFIFYDKMAAGNIEIVDIKTDYDYTDMSTITLNFNRVVLTEKDNESNTITLDGHFTFWK